MSYKVLAYLIKSSYLEDIDRQHNVKNDVYYCYYCDVNA